VWYCRANQGQSATQLCRLLASAASLLTVQFKTVEVGTFGQTGLVATSQGNMSGVLYIYI